MEEQHKQPMDQDMEVESPSKPRANGSSGKATTSRRPHMGGVSKSRQERQFHPYTPGQKRELKNTKRLLQEREEELARTKAELREKEKTLDRVLPVVRNFYEERAVPQYKDLLSVLVCSLSFLARDLLSKCAGVCTFVLDGEFPTLRCDGSWHTP